jgi:hypothetical protein
MRLTAIERETIINFNQAEDVAYIYTCNPKWWRLFEKMGVIPTVTHRDSKGEIYANEYQIPKDWIKAPKPPKRMRFTVAQKQACGERLRKARMKR